MTLPRKTKGNAQAAKRLIVAMVLGTLAGIACRFAPTEYETVCKLLVQMFQLIAG